MWNISTSPDKQGGIMLTSRVGRGGRRSSQSSQNDNILSGAVSETDNLVWNTNIIHNNYTAKLNGWFLLLLSQKGSQRVDKSDNWPPEGFYNGIVYFSDNWELKRHESGRWRERNRLKSELVFISPGDWEIERFDNRWREICLTSLAWLSWQEDLPASCPLPSSLWSCRVQVWLWWLAVTSQVWSPITGP